MLLGNCSAIVSSRKRTAFVQVEFMGGTPFLVGGVYNYVNYVNPELSMGGPILKRGGCITMITML